MCGIAGIIDLEGKQNFEEKVKQLCHAMQHRGPDATGVVQKNNVCFGHQRLSIIDLSSNANQPFWNHNQDILLILNGEIYNYKTLKNKLLDYPFITHSDTEVLIAAYQKWGIEMIHQIEGMFAFAIYDLRSNEVFIGRDRMGKKPIYYTNNQATFAFSSELRPLLKTGLAKPVLNKNVLGYYLQFQTVHYPETLVQDIKMIPPGTYFKIANGNVCAVTYWNAEIEGNKQCHRFEPQTLQNLFYQSVEKRLVSDVPLAVLLSGGIDSNLILAAASNAQKVDTFTIGFDEEGFDESTIAEKSAKHFGSNHHTIKLKATDLLCQIPNILDAMDHPSGDGPNTYLISQAIKKTGFTVALSGLGGDELFFGYPHYAHYQKIKSNILIKTAPNFVLSAIAKALKNNKINKLEAVKRSNSAADGILSFRSNYSNQILKNHFGLIPYQLDNQYQKLDQFNAISRYEMEYYMCDVLLRDADQMSMAHSIELRNPFLDRQVINYIWGVQEQQKTLANPKEMLLDAMGHLLPNYILEKKKTGFTFPWESWMRNELADFCEQYMLLLEEKKIFKDKSIIAVWNGFKTNSKIFTWSRVWPLVCLSYWIEKHEIKS